MYSMHFHFMAEKLEVPYKSKTNDRITLYVWMQQLSILQVYASLILHIDNYQGRIFAKQALYSAAKYQEPLPHSSCALGSCPSRGCSESLVKQIDSQTAEQAGGLHHSASQDTTKINTRLLNQN